jgi:hypothetical protein
LLIVSTGVRRVFDEQQAVPARKILEPPDVRRTSPEVHRQEATRFWRDGSRRGRRIEVSS